jgi:hypothetical protein
MDAIFGESGAGPCPISLADTLTDALACLVLPE